VPPPQAPPPPPYASAKQRDSWYIGFGLGSGDGRVIFSEGTADFADMVYPGRDTFSFNFRVGATVSPRLLLGLDLGALGAVANEGAFESNVDLTYWDAGMMFFPAERGFYLRAALGLSALSQNVEGPFGTTEASVRGFNVLGGLGYAFWLGRAFNLTVNVDAARHWFDDAEVEGATAWSAWVGFDWY
jgi:hypothetical protein